MPQWTRRQCIKLSLLGLSGVLTGCGGSTAPVDPSNSAANGRLTLQIEWPVPTRLIPQATNVIQVRVLQGSLELGRQTLLRPTGVLRSEATFTNLPTGNLTVVAEAFSSDLYAAIARAEFPVAMGSGQTVPIELTLASTITRMHLYPGSFSDTVDRVSTQLLVAARDADGRYLVLSPSQLVWQSSNPAVATLSPTTAGKFIYIGEGTTALSVRDSESGVSTSIELTLQTAGPLAGVRTFTDTKNPYLPVYDPTTDTLYSSRPGTTGSDIYRVSWTDGTFTTIGTTAGIMSQLIASPERGRVYFTTRNTNSTNYRLGYFSSATGAITMITYPAGNPFTTVYPLSSSPEALVVHRLTTNDIAIYDPETQTTRPITFAANKPTFLDTENPNQVIIVQKTPYGAGTTTWLTRLNITAQGVYPLDNILPAPNTPGPFNIIPRSILSNKKELFTESQKRYDIHSYALINDYFYDTQFFYAFFAINAEGTRGYYLTSLNSAWLIDEIDTQTGEAIARKTLLNHVGGASGSFITWCGQRRVALTNSSSRSITLVDFSVP
jgi:hypothetical protein